jgi:predicted regulator of Ras-like GTPase activity (Roadblock/LC7/MglB family)
MASFELILDELLTNVPQSVGAIFLDSEGETVELLGYGIPADTLKILGAYHGIYLGQLRRLSSTIDGGEIERFRVAFEKTVVFTVSLRDGYYVMLISDPEVNEGVAWRHLARTRERLLAEL